MSFDSGVQRQDAALESGDVSPHSKYRPYPAYKDSGVEWLGKIPAHWGVARFKRVARLMYGDSLPDEGRDAGDVEVFGSNGPVGLHSTPNTMAPAVIIGRKGSYGKVNYSLRPVFAIDTTYFIDERTSTQDLRWLFYAAQLLGLDTYSEDSAIPGLSREFVYSRMIVVPPIEEQQEITHFLDRETAKIDALVAKKERLIELLQEKRAALINSAATKGLDPNVAMKDSGVDWLGEVPAHWGVKRMKHVSDFVTSGSRGWAEYYSDAGSIFLRIGNLRAGGIDLDLSELQYVSPPPSAEGERTRVRVGDVLVSITALIGAVGVVPRDLPESYVNQHLALVRLRDRGTNSRWLAYCLLSRVGQEQVKGRLYGGTKDGLGLEDVRSLVVLLPPSEEQESIVGLLDLESRKLDALIARIRDGIERLKEHRTALISAAVTGKIDVREEAV